MIGGNRILCGSFEFPFWGPYFAYFLVTIMQALETGKKKNNEKKEKVSVVETSTVLPLPTCSE